MGMVLIKSFVAVSFAKKKIGFFKINLLFLLGNDKTNIYNAAYNLYQAY